MSPDTCEIFLNGFCPKKQLCEKSHDVKNCSLGPNCSNNNCELRHPPFCEKILQGKCGFHLNGQFIIFSKCAFFHPARNIKPTFPQILLPIPHHALHYPPMHPPTTHLPVPPPTLHPLLPPQLDNFNISSRMYSLEDQIRKASTAVSNLTNELEAIKTEVHKNNFNDSSDKINTFLQKAVIWSEKLEELFKHSKQQAQLVTDMAGTLETNMQREMEELRTDVKRIEAVEEEPGTQSGARIDNL